MLQFLTIHFITLLYSWLFNDFITKTSRLSNQLKENLNFFAFGIFCWTYAAILFDKGQRSIEAWYFMFSICFFNASRSMVASTLASILFSANRNDTHTKFVFPFSDVWVMCMYIGGALVVVHLWMLKPEMLWKVAAYSQRTRMPCTA